MPKFALSLLVAAIALLTPSAAGAQLLVGVQDDPVFVRLPTAYGGLGARGTIPASVGYARLAQLGASVLRIAVNWSVVEPRASARSEGWSHYDSAVAAARRAGETVQLVLTGPAPAWATADRRVGVYRPSPAAFARFAAAAARRYRGRVSTYSLWSEPNWWSSLKPNPLAPVLYRALYLAGYSAVRRADPQAQVLFGELAPIGYGGAAIAPLRFLREVTCRTQSLRPSRRCASLVADGFALHPYTLRWPPTFPGNGPDDVTTGSLPRLARVLAVLARVHALTTPSGEPPPVFLTEYGWSPRYVHSEKRRAALAVASFRLIARVPQVREIVWYELAAPPSRPHPLWNTALLTHRGAPTPVFTALREWIASSGAGSGAGSRS